MALVFLCGNKACGKTFFLNKLIKNYNINGYDLDQQILKSNHATQYKTIRQLYNNVGELQFRQIEKNVFNTLVSDVLSTDKKNAVIALGGGALDLIKECNKVGKTVYLYQNPDVLFARMEKLGLPSFIKNKEDFEKLFEFRDSFYLKNCSCKLDLSKTGDKEACQILLEMYLN